MAGSGGPAKAFSGLFCPFRSRYRIPVCRKVVVEDELVDLRALSHGPDLVHVGVKGFHSFEGGACESVLLQIGEVSNLVNENVSAPGKSNQTVVHGGVAREHDGPVRGVEAVRQGGSCSTVRDGNRTHPNSFVLERDDGDLRGAGGLGRKGEVESPHELCRVRHVGVERHDVEVVGVAGDNMVDQVRRSGCRQLRVDRRLAVEVDIAARKGTGTPGSIEREPARVGPHCPRGCPMGRGACRLGHRCGPHGDA